MLYRPGRGTKSVLSYFSVSRATWESIYSHAYTIALAWSCDIALRLGLFYSRPWFNCMGDVTFTRSIYSSRFAERFIILSKTVIKDNKKMLPSEDMLCCVL